MTAKRSISLSDDLDEFAHSLVDNDKFSGLSSVIQYALSDLRQKLANEKTEIEALSMLVDRRRQGEFISKDEMTGCTSRMIENKRRDYGLSD